MQTSGQAKCTSFSTKLSFHLIFCEFCRIEEVNTRDLCNRIRRIDKWKV